MVIRRPVRYLLIGVGLLVFAKCVQAYLVSPEFFHPGVALVVLVVAVFAAAIGLRRDRAG